MLPILDLKTELEQMSSSLAKQISARMKAKNLTINDIEKEAGLKTHAVRNILRGKSKRPSAEILQSIADVLHCDIRELLSKDESQEDNLFEIQKEILNSLYEYPKLFIDTAQALNKKFDEKGIKVTIKQYISCVEEVYIHSLQKDPRKVDLDFVDWFVDLIET